MKTLKAILAGLMLVGLGTFAVMAQDGAAPADEAPVSDVKAQSVCPIDGNPINTETYADVEGFKIYACCADCVEKIKADPKSALEKIAAAGETAEALEAQ